MFRLTLIAVVVVAIGGGLYLAYTQPSSLPPQLQQYAPLLKTSIDTGLSGAQVALSKSKNAQPAVLGVKTETSRIFQEDTNGKPIHQKAMEFAQYEYCKLIVKNYEEDQSKASASATPTESPEKK